MIKCPYNDKQDNRLLCSGELKPYKTEGRFHGECPVCGRSARLKVSEVDGKVVITASKIGRPELEGDGELVITSIKIWDWQAKKIKETGLNLSEFNREKLAEEFGYAKA